MSRKVLLGTICSLFVMGLKAQTVNLVQLFNAGLSSPIAAHFSPGNDSLMFIVQQGGLIKIGNVNTGVVSGTNFLNITNKITSSGNEQGLLGLAFHPDYQQNGYFFVNYTKTSGGATVVARYKRSTANPLVADPNSEKIVLQVNQPYSNHNGGQLQFGKDGYLYIGMGDGGSANDPQNYSQNGLSRLGKMLRVDIDVDSGYVVPPTNPFIGDATKLPEIWAIGVRNPWRFSFDQVTGNMWMGDVGQNNWEEINFEPQGQGGNNYGWKCYEGNAPHITAGCASSSAYDFPVYVYSHAGGNCSVTGGFVYRGGSFADFYGKYVFTDFCSGKFWFTAPDGSGGWTTNQVTTSPSLTNQITSFVQNNSGEMYVVSRSGNRIYRMTGTLCAAADIYTESGALESCTGSLELMAPYSALNSYHWYRNDTLLPGAVSSTYLATVTGIYKVVATNINNNCSNQKVAEVLIGSSEPAVVSLPQNSFCADDLPVQVTATPAGGTLSGPGITGNSFNPSGLSGVQTISYTVTSDGCTQTGSTTVTVTTPPTVEWTAPILLEAYCLNEEIALSGTPAGGTFSGPGVSGNTFITGNAGVGNFTVTYTYTDANGCTGSAVSPVLLVSSCYVSISETNPAGWELFPNPTSGMLFIRSGAELKRVSILSSAGATVWESSTSGLEFQADISHLSGGIYTVRVEGGEGSLSFQKIILIK